ncbi:MAG: 50S ribosomal protein L13 [Clostridiales bacterium]|nr:50S ribosomal protein L13 [Clostridiales bacterium]
MKTFMANPNNVERKWFVVDATNMPLGRLASQVADILSGKNKPDYTPHVDTGDFVIILNTDKVVLTGKKLTQKFYRTHSGYVGGLKETNYQTMMAKASDEVVLKAVKGMLPKTVLGRKQATRCKVYKGAEHNQTAQQPIKVELKGVRN